MIKIRQEQIESMLMHDEEKFIDFVVKHVQQECSDDVRGIDPLYLLDYYHVNNS
jgi:hypothetical protein